MSPYAAEGERLRTGQSRTGPTDLTGAAFAGGILIVIAIGAFFGLRNERRRRARRRREIVEESRVARETSR